jgi:hypothetical protein
MSNTEAIVDVTFIAQFLTELEQEGKKRETRLCNQSREILNGSGVMRKSDQITYRLDLTY